ncbi:hypothetical protein QBC44DRAFT_6906 [Cladorrhinum sp. PSN332]|nr:hypothetical protein QBC44DRAFT_6906 [Cladorrhinum sp. PSN332]
MAVAASRSSSPSPGGISSVFAITKAKVFLVVSLIITWWFASLIPHYKPAIKAHFSAQLNQALQKMPTIKVDWEIDTDPLDVYNASKVALLIEPRPLPHLVPHILYMIGVVPPDWRFLFIGSEKSVAGVEEAAAIRHQQVAGKLDLMVLPEPWDIGNKEGVYRTLTDVRFYDEFMPGVEWILKYEADSILCANSETSVDEWLHWDFVGAPRRVDDHFAGNGGLSLRRASAIRRVLSFQARLNNSDPEDEWFGKRVYVLPGAKTAKGVEEAFTVEDVYFENSMGFHIRDGGNGINSAVWEDPDQRKKIFNYCPEISLIMDMKLERERCKGDNKKGSII